MLIFVCIFNIKTFPLFRAIQASLELYKDGSSPSDAQSSPTDLDYDLQMALLISRKECEKDEQTRMDEEKVLEQILQLSLTEK